MYQQHWWKCDGPCQNRKPFYGTVRRAVNRAPSRHDHWWAEHQRTCGGKFIKIKEPEGYSSSRGKKRKTSPDVVMSHSGTTGTHTGTHTGTTGIHTGTTGTCAGTSGIHTRITETFTGTMGIQTETMVIHNETTGSRFKLDDSSNKDKREKMLKAAEKRLTASKNKGCPTTNSRDIRTFMTPPPDHTPIIIDSTPITINSTPITIESTPSKSSSKSSCANSTLPLSKLTPPTLTPPIKNKQYKTRTCPVCGREDIPLATINVHISFCLEEMELDFSSSDSEN